MAMFPCLPPHLSPGFSSFHSKYMRLDLSERKPNGVNQSGVSVGFTEVYLDAVSSSLGARWMAKCVSMTRHELLPVLVVER